MNCTFIGNSATSGGAIYCKQGISSSRTEVSITNCIFWDNSNEQISRGSGTATVSYSCIQGGYQGVGNIDANPLFVGLSGDDYHLLPASLCIDTGDPNYVAEEDETDLDGNPRVIGGRIDMGAYEFPNVAPVADAGLDKVVFAGPGGTAAVELDGSGSYDGDGDELSYLWTWRIRGQAHETNTINPVIELGVGEYIIELIVNDGVEDSEVDSCLVRVVEAVEVSMKFTPQAVNLFSKGKWVKGHIVLQEGFSIDDVDAGAGARLEPFGVDSDHADVFVNDDGMVEVEAVFERSQLRGTVVNGSTVEVTVSGKFASGQCFYGRDTIKITRMLEHFGVISSHWLKTDCGAPDWCGGADVDHSSVVDLSDLILSE
jgi:predicted outer membrane repeat protein